MASNPPSSPAAGDRELLAVLQARISTGQLDVGTALWQAASLGSAETLELILQLPNAKEKINDVPENSPFSPLMAAAKIGSLDCVKLLLYHGANLYYCYSNILVANVKVWHVARKERHTIVEQYLKSCESDYQKCGTSRAYLELTVKHIASNPDCTPADNVNFFDCLRNLVNYCKFDVNSICDEERKKCQPLLLRATRSDNSVIVTRLLGEFHAKHDIRDPFTGENFLHVCFKSSSKLRFHYITEYPDLIHQSDKAGKLPLFYACENNDITFFKWLLQESHSATSSTPAVMVHSELQLDFTHTADDMLEEEHTRLGRMSQQYRNFTIDRDRPMEPGIPPSPHIAEVVNMRPFTMAQDGNSILHILADQGAYQILSTIVRVCSYVEGFDFSSLCVRRNKNFPLPIEKALSSKNIRCVAVLIDLAINTYQLPMLLNDKHILKAAVVTKSLENVKTMIVFGFHTGVELAITLAAAYKLPDIVRLLLIWEVEVQNYLDFPQTSRLRQTLRASKLNWKQLELQYVDPCWLSDAQSATSIAANTLIKLKENNSFQENNVVIYQELGERCIDYFEGDGLTPLPPPVTGASPGYTNIVNINLSENHLESVPPEIFQLSSLACLDVKYNEIHSLPTSEDFSSSLYSAKLESLCLDYNKLESLPDDLIWGLANSLQSLSVQNNKLAEIPPGLWLMPKLTILKLANNHLTTLHYMSKTHLFVSTDLAEKIASLEVVDGSIQCPGNITADEADSLKKHVNDLASLYRTAISIKFPESKFSEEFLLTELVQVYRSRHHFLEVVNAGEIPTPISETDVTTFALAFTLSEAAFTSNLKFLDLSYNSFRFFPWDLQCLAPKLVKLDMGYNSITGMDIIRDFPREIDNVSLQMNKITSVSHIRSIKLPCGNPVELLSINKLSSLGSLNACKHTQHEILEKLTRINLDNNLLTRFPVLKSELAHEGAECQMNSTATYPLFPDLAILSLASNKFRKVPQHLHRIRHLSSLILSHNPIEELPEDMGLINTDYITLIKLEGIKPRNIPEHLLNSSARKLVKYLKDLKQRAKPHRVMKLMLVGEANKGKTSLLLNLTKRGQMTHFSTVDKGYNDIPLSTVGVELGEFKYSPHVNRPTITFMTWDFGGQDEYYATHQCFLTKRSIYLLLWNIQDGEEGLKNLKPWLENIESCAPQSPVIVVGTHLDQISPNSVKDRERILISMQSAFDDMYITERNTSRTYPTIFGKLYFIDVHNARQVDQLRDNIYEFAMNFRPCSRCRQDDTMEGAPLLDKLVPESYIVLHDFVRSLAERCRLLGAHPVLTRAQLINELAEAGYSFENDFEQVSSFLHENGILLHYDDIGRLNDLYFIDPQWLCKMVARIITIRLKNPYYNKGFMWMRDVTKLFSSYADEFIDLLSKFEVVFKLDERRLVIPSLLPDSEEDACLVYSNALSHDVDTSSLLVTDVEGYDSFAQLDMQLFCRYFLLPFIPHGFFTRLIARLMGSDIIDHLQKSLKGDPLETVHVSSTIHWNCWRNGIVLVWNRKEIFRVAPLANTGTNASQSKIILITKKKMHKVLSSPSGLEIKVAVIPEVKIRKCTFLEPAVERMSEGSEGFFSNLDNPSKGKCIAAWLLHKATSMVDSIFNDWYEGFGSIGQEDEFSSAMRMANYCSNCLCSAHQSAYSNVISSLHMFSSTYCCFAACKGMMLDCPAHGQVKVEDIAPDLVFGDFHPSTVFSDSSTFKIKTLYPLGSGGYGTVFKATYQRKPSGNFDPVHIAQKQIHSTQVTFTEDPDILAQLKAWSMYQKASTEARVMNKLSHRHVLALIGVCFQAANNQLSILIELAPKGDLKSIVQEYKSEGVRLGRRTTKATLIQVAEAMEYLHSLNIIYRDLKPQNILVWKFPNAKSSSNKAVVHVKVADYGISSVINPHQGNIKGLDGTQPYQSPEILIFGGKKAYSFHVDVYAFGMCIYFLVAQQHPFIDTHVSVALKEERRPKIPNKLQPHSVPITDLMCWCWSDMPQDRPNFTQILEALNSEAFTNLLAAAEVVDSQSGSQVTTACINSIVTPKMKISVPKDCHLASLSRLMSLVHGRSTRRGEPAMQVIYGTDKGHCEMIQFQSSGAVKKIIEIPLKHKKYISSIRVVDDRIWISTVGSGIFVYNAITLQYEASWGDANKEKVYNLLVLKETNSIIALTSRGIFSFKTELNSGRFFDYLDYHTSCPSDFGGIMMNVGAVVPTSGNMKKCEVWVCSHSERKFYVLNPITLDTSKEVECSDGDLAAAMKHDLVSSQRLSNTRRSNITMIVRIREMQVVEVGLRIKMAVADNWKVLLLDVESHKLEGVFDCREYCKSHQDDLPAFLNVTKAQISSLDARGDILYTGLENGLILCLKCGPDISVSLQFTSYNGPISSVMVMTPPHRNQPHNQVEPASDSTHYHTERQRKVTPPKTAAHLSKRKTTQALVPLRSKRQQSLDITPGSFKVNSSYQTAGNVLLVSLGRAYTGITGSHENHPKEFILPSVGLVSGKRLTKAEKLSSHLLIWSTEICDLVEGEESEEILEDEDLVARAEGIVEEKEVDGDNKTFQSASPRDFTTSPTVPQPGEPLPPSRRHLAPLGVKTPEDTLDETCIQGSENQEITEGVRELEGVHREEFEEESTTLVQERTRDKSKDQRQYENLIL